MAKLLNRVPEVKIKNLRLTDPRYFEFVSKFEEVVFTVSADSFACLELWSRNFQKVSSESKRIIYSWEEINHGFCPTIGICDHRPVNLMLMYAILNGHRVLFYDPVSQVVDHELIDKFLKLNFPGVSNCDANNFHQCLHAVSKVANPG